MSLQAKLAAGLAELGLSFDAAIQQRFLQYIALLHKWNKVYNLTAVREPEKMLYQHVLDSLAVLPYALGPRLLDVGTGAGLPGVPLAIARPDLAVTLLDSNHKRTVFLRQACIELALTNVTVVCERVEAWQPDASFDQVISRAFSDMGEFVRLVARLCAPGGMILAMKGLYPHDELGHLPAGVTAEQVIPLKVPGLEAQRHLVLIKVA